MILSERVAEDEAAMNRAYSSGMAPPFARVLLIEPDRVIVVALFGTVWFNDKASNNPLHEKKEKRTIDKIKALSSLCLFIQFIQQEFLNILLF